MIRCRTICALISAALAATSATARAQPGVQAGVLKCRGASTTSFVVGSVHQLTCVFHSDRGPRYRYYALIRRVGLDIGFTEQSTLVWAVFAPTHWIGPGDLSGSYGGVTAGVAVGVGGNANALVGGSNNSFALQPLSFEGQTGLNVAVGIAGIELRYWGGGLHKKPRRAQMQPDALPAGLQFSARPKKTRLTAVLGERVGEK
jgi:hypothetical protein